MQMVEVNSWKACRDSLFRFGQLSRTRRNQWWFRGHSDFEHSLTPTIDRDRSFADDASREVAISELVLEFRREAMSIGFGPQLPAGEALELLARHHGLPSPYLDWTRSPVVAACFAFLDPRAIQSENVALLALDLSKLDPAIIEPTSRQLELIDDSDRVAMNRRAAQQRAVFMRRSTIRKGVEDLLGDSLFKFKISSRERESALLDLDQAMVNATNLYYDLDGAAMTAAWRCR